MIVLVSVTAEAAEKKRPECESLISILHQSVDKLIAGDFSDRVKIALAAHERLKCPAVQLLDVLRIKKPDD